MRRRVCYVKYLETYGQLKIPVPILAYVLSLWHKDVNYSEVKVRILQKYKMLKYKYNFFLVLIAVW